MTLDLATVVPFHGPQPIGAERRPQSRVSAVDRRAFLRHLVGVGMLVGLNVLGFLPPARRALADHADDDMASSCSGLGSWVDNDDCNGCNRSPCSDCCDSGWHKHTGIYQLRPDECDPGNYDGWYWTYAPCCWNGCQNQKWRCHDGYKNGQPTICRTRTQASCNCSICACIS